MLIRLFKPDGTVLGDGLSIKLVNREQCRFKFTVDLVTAEAVEDELDGIKAGGSPTLRFVPMESREDASATLAAIHGEMPLLVVRSWRVNSFRDATHAWVTARCDTEVFEEMVEIRRRSLGLGPDAWEKYKEGARWADKEEKPHA